MAEIKAEIPARIEEFGRKLCGEARGWKAAFADKLGISANQLSALLNGRDPLGNKTQQRLRDLGADVDYILTGRRSADETGSGMVSIQFSMEGFHTKEQAEKYKEAMQKLDQVTKDDPEAAEKILVLLDMMFKKK